MAAPLDLLDRGVIVRIAVSDSRNARAEEEVSL